MRLVSLNCKRDIFILVSLFFLVAACSSASPEQTNTPTFTRTQIATPTTTITPQPTSTVTPTETLTTTPTHSPTPRPTITPTPTPPVISIENANNLVQVYRSGKGPVSGIAWWPDTNTLAVVSWAGISLYDARTYKELRFIEAPEKVILRHFALSPDGQTVASAGLNDNVVKLWGIETGKILHVLEGQKEYIHALAFSPKNHLLASGGFGTILMWDIETGKVKYTLKGLPNQAIFHLSFSKDGSMLVAVGCGRQYCNGLGIWDTDEGRLLRTLNMPRGGSSAASLSADGSLLAVGGDKDVYIYETTTGILQQKIQVNSSHILSLALSPDARKLVTGSSWWQPLELWSLDTGELIYTLSPEAAAENIILSRDGKVAVTNASEWVHIWQLSNGLMLKDLNMAQAVKPIPVIYRDNTFNASSDSQFTYRIGYQENGTYYIQLLDAITGDQLKILEGELKNRIWYSSFSPDQDLFAAGDEDGNVYVWDTKRGNLLYTLRHRNLSSMAFSPDGSILATGGSRTLKIINPNTGEIIKELYQSSEIIGILFSPDGKLLASTGWSEVQLWDITTLQQLFRFPGGGGRASFSPDSRLIAIRSYIYATRGYKQFISLWNVMNGELLHKFKGEDTYFTGGGPLQFSPDGQLFVATGMTDNIARIFEVETGKFVDLTLPVESSDFSFSSEGHFLIFNCEDGTVRVFGVK